MKTIIPWLLILFLTVACPACTSANLTGEGSGPKSGDILFSDDFSDSNTGWGVWNQEGAKVEIDSGGLRIFVQEEQYDFWSVAGKDFDDVTVEVDALKMGGPDDNDLGLICRYQDENNFYMLLVSNDGYFGIAKMKDGQYSMIGADQLQYSQYVGQGQAANHLRADCIGQTLTLYANGQKLHEVQDMDFLTGDVGLLAGAYDEPNVDILFDNFVVKKP